MSVFKSASLLLFFSIVISAFPVDPENVIITEIIDCNLFKLEDGRLITLANVNLPGRKSFSSYRKKVLVKKILKYEEDNLIGRRLYAEFADSVQSDSVYAVHLFNRYPVNKCHFNLYFLEKGFGYYNPEPESQYTELYSETVTTDQEKKKMSVRHRKKSRAIKDLEGRLRIMGGIIGTIAEYQGPEGEIEAGAIPMLAASCRISKLVPIFEKNGHFLSLAGGIDNYLLIFPHIHLGPEIRIYRQFAFSADFGGLFPILSKFHPIEPCWSLTIGYIAPSRKFEIEAGYTFINIYDAAGVFRVMLSGSAFFTK